MAGERTRKLAAGPAEGGGSRADRPIGGLAPAAVQDPQPSPERAPSLYQLTDQYMELLIIAERLEERRAELEAAPAPDPGDTEAVKARAAAVEDLARRRAAMEAALEIQAENVKEKAPRVAAVVKQIGVRADYLQWYADQYANIAANLKAQVKTRRQAAEGLQRFLALALGRLSDETVRAGEGVPSVTLAAKSSSRTIRVRDELAVADEYCRAEMTKIPLKEVPPELRQYIKAREVNVKELEQLFQRTGVAPKGTEIVERPRRLTIRP